MATWNPEDWWSIPADMQNLPQWMVCGPDKVPQTLSGYRGDPTNPACWSKFADAVDYAERNHMWVGFCLTADDPILVVDMDNKRNDESDVARIAHIGGQLASLGTYIEKSMSGTGYHAVMYGDIGVGRRAQNIEVYSQDRFMIMTGDYVQYGALKRDDQWVQGLIGSMEAVLVTSDSDYEDKPADRNTDAVIQAIMSSKSGDKFARLMGAEWAVYTDDRTREPYGRDPSSADMALATIICYFTPNNAQVWDIFSRSALAQRLKNGQPRHPNGINFLRHTVAKARGYNSRDAARNAEVDFSGAAANMLGAKLAMAEAQKAADVARAQGMQPTTLAQAANMGTPPVPMRNFPTKHAREIINEPAIEWAVQSIFQHRHVNAIYGWSGVGKSFIALDMAAAVATGGEWFGYKTTAMPVLYVAIEGGSSLNQRLAAYEKGTGAEYPQNVEFYRGKFKLTDADLITDFIAQRKVQGQVGGMIIIDTLSKAIAGVDENSNAEMAKVVEQLELLRDGLNACVIVVHHSTKPDPKTGIAGHMRGAGALQAGIEGVLEVTKRPYWAEDIQEDQKKNTDPIGFNRSLKTSKVKDGSDLGFDDFMLNVVETGAFDNFGDKVTSCWIQAVPRAPMGSMRQDTPTWNQNQPAEAQMSSKEQRASIRAQSRQGAPVSGAQSEEMNLGRLDFKTAIPTAFTIIEGSGQFRPNTTAGVPDSKIGIPRESLITKVIDLLNSDFDPKDKKFQKRIIDALAYEVQSERVGKVTVGGRAYYWRK